MLKALATALLLTVALEGTLACLWGPRTREHLALVALVNCLTNPPVNLLYSLLVGLWGWPALPVTALLEAAAVAVEWRCYRALDDGLRRPFLFSLCANAFSFFLGSLLLYAV